MDWNEMAAPWLKVEAETDAAHGPVLDRLMQAASLTEGQSVLDIGPGGGVSLLRAAEAVGPTGKVTGIEIAPPFAERARARVPANVEVIVGDAASHSLDAAPFDCAISMFGVMFFADPVAAFRHIRGMLRPGGALTFACWGPPPVNPWFSMPGRMAAQVFGPGEAFDPDGPGPMAFGDTAKIDRILSDAGWRAEIATHDLHLTPIGAPEVVAVFQMTIGAAAQRIKAAKNAGTLTDDHKTRLLELMTHGFSEMAQGDVVRVPANIHIVRAVA